MGREWATRSFKSGNSVAVRIPAEVGIEAGKDWVLVEGDGELILRARDALKRKFNIAKVAGSAKNLKFISPEHRIFEERPLLWDDPEWRAKHMPGE